MRNTSCLIRFGPTEWRVASPAKDMLNLQFEMLPANTGYPLPVLQKVVPVLKIAQHAINSNGADPYCALNASAQGFINEHTAFMQSVSA